ncbi:MAG: FHA domain-containing protein, partial [Planctomycetota bacterium]|nr:FHA domain-containing protein [Planctomycetota bacterium]
MTAFVLQLFDGVGKVRILPIPGDEATLGRGASCDIQLDKPGLEELHCRFLCQGNGVMFKDESSERSAKINGKKPRRGEGRLKPGDELSLGDSTLILQTKEKAEAEAKALKKQSAERSRKKKAAKADGSPTKRSAVRKAPKRAPEPEPESESEIDQVSSEDLDEYEESDDEGESYSDRLAYRRQRKMQQWARTAVPIVIVLIVAWFFLKKMKSNDVGEDNQVADSSDSKKKGSSGTPENGPAKSGAATDADVAWGRLQKLDTKSLVTGLEGFSRRFPGDRRAPDARFYSSLLKRQGSGGSGRVLAKLLSEAKKVEFAGDWGRSYSLLGLAVVVDPRSKAAIQAKREQLRIERMAEEAFQDLSARANLMAQNMGPVQSLILVLESRDLYRGLSFDGKLDALVKLFENQIASQSERRGPGDGYSAEASTLEHDAIQLALRLDFKPAREKLDQILELNLREKERFKVHWLRQQVLALRDLVQAMIKMGSMSFKDRPELTLPGNIKARLKDADDTHLILSAEKGRGELRWPWNKLTPFQIQELFHKVTPTDLRLCEAKSFHAFKTGLSDTGFEILIPFAKKKRYRSEVFSFY